MQMKMQHNSIKRPYRNKAFTSPKVNTTWDLVLQDENRGYFASNAKNNKNVPIWTWLEAQHNVRSQPPSAAAEEVVQMTRCRGVSQAVWVSAFNELVMSDPSLPRPSFAPGPSPGRQAEQF